MYWHGKIFKALLSEKSKLKNNRWYDMLMCKKIKLYTHVNMGGIKSGYLWVKKEFVDRSENFILMYFYIYFK